MLRFPVPGAPLTPTDNERTLMKPLIRILEKAGIRWGIGCADWLPIDPQHCAAEIGLNLRHVKLSEGSSSKTSVAKPNGTKMFRSVFLNNVKNGVFLPYK